MARRTMSFGSAAFEAAAADCWNKVGVFYRTHAGDQCPSMIVRHMLECLTKVAPDLPPEAQAMRATIASSAAASTPAARHGEALLAWCEARNLTQGEVAAVTLAASCSVAAVWAEQQLEIVGRPPNLADGIAALGLAEALGHLIQVSPLRVPAAS